MSIVDAHVGLITVDLAGAGDLFGRCSIHSGSALSFCGPVFGAGGRTGEPQALISARTGAHCNIGSVGTVQLVSQQF